MRPFSAGLSSYACYAAKRQFCAGVRPHTPATSCPCTASRDSNRPKARPYSLQAAPTAAPANRWPITNNDLHSYCSCRRHSPPWHAPIPRYAQLLLRAFESKVLAADTEYTQLQKLDTFSLPSCQLHVAVCLQNESLGCCCCCCRCLGLPLVVTSNCREQINKQRQESQPGTGYIAAARQSQNSGSKNITCLVAQCLSGSAMPTWKGKQTDDER